MEIANARRPRDLVKVEDAGTISGVPHVRLGVGRGTGSRRSTLSASEAWQVAYALLFRAEQLSN